MNTITMLSTILLAFQTAPATPKKEAGGKAEGRMQSYFEYRDSDQNLTFKMENGKVEVTAPADKGKGEMKIYKADSFAQFRQQYPEVVKRYDLDRILPRPVKSLEAEKWWTDWATRFGTDEESRLRAFWKEFPKESTDAFRDLDRWFDEEHRALSDLERRYHDEGRPLVEPPAAISRVTLGILVAPVTDILRSQLGLAPHEGLVVADVQKDSLAQRSGVEKNDVLLKITGQRIEDTGKFRDQVKSALEQGKDFALELIRGGKHMTLTVHPEHS